MLDKLGEGQGCVCVHFVAAHHRIWIEIQQISCELKSEMSNTVTLFLLCMNELLHSSVHIAGASNNVGEYVFHFHSFITISTWVLCFVTPSTFGPGTVSHEFCLNLITFNEKSFLQQVSQNREWTEMQRELHGAVVSKATTSQLIKDGLHGKLANVTQAIKSFYLSVHITLNDKKQNQTKTKHQHITNSQWSTINPQKVHSQS